MKNVIGLDIYRQYQKDIERIKKEVMENRSENDNDSALLLVHNDEDKQTLMKYFGVSGITLVIMIVIAVAFLKSYELSKYLWIVGAVFVGWLILFIVLFSLNKKKKKKILEEKEKKDVIEKSVVAEFKDIQESFYSIVLYVICINEYYQELIQLEGEERTKRWKEILDREMEAINYALNYNISIASYQQYFSNWLATQEVYG